MIHCFEQKNQHAIKDIGNKKVIVVVGKSGAGKNVVVNGLCGVKMSRLWHGGLECECVDTIDEDDCVVEIDHFEKQKEKIPDVVNLTRDTIIFNCPGYDKDIEGDEEMSSFLWVKYAIEHAKQTQVMLVAQDIWEYHIIGIWEVLNSLEMLLLMLQPQDIMVILNEVDEAINCGSLKEKMLTFDNCPSRLMDIKFISFDPANSIHECNTDAIAKEFLSLPKRDIIITK